jgi:hypothetical protein
MALADLPAASKRSIHLHEEQQLAQLRLGDLELRREHSGIAVQHCQIARGASSVSDVGEPPRIRGRAVQELQLLSKVAAFTAHLRENIAAAELTLPDAALEALGGGASIALNSREHD